MIPHRNRCRGVALYWTAIVIMLLVAMGGLATDLAYVVLSSQQLQIGADASALAAGRYARGVAGDYSLGREAARSIAVANRVAGTPLALALNEDNNSEGDIVFGYYDRDSGSFTAQTSGTNAVLVNARRTAASAGGALPLNFAAIFGIYNIDVSRRAIAMIGGGTGAGLIALNRDADPGLYIHGDLSLTVNGGDIQVNSSSNKSTRLQGAFTVDAENINAVGGIDTIGRSGDLVDTQLVEGATVVDDPLGWLEAPAQPPLGSVSGGVYTPGYYPSGIGLTGGDITLQPGIYYLGGAGFSIGGNTNLTGEGVMLYIAEGSLDMTGTGNVYLRPPDSGYYEGVMVFQARDNTSPSRVLGTSGLDVEGTLYFPSALLTITGTTNKLGTQIISDTVEIGGNGELTINYDGRFPAPGRVVFLVR